MMRVGVQVLPQALKEAGTRQERPAALALRRRGFGSGLRLADQHPAAGAARGGGELRLRHLVRFFKNQQVEDQRNRWLRIGRTTEQEGGWGGDHIGAVNQLLRQCRNPLLDGSQPLLGSIGALNRFFTLPLPFRARCCNRFSSNRRSEEHTSELQSRRDLV